MERQESFQLHYMLHVTMRETNPRPWQVQHEINTEIGVTLFVKFVPILCGISLKTFSGYNYVLHANVKRRLFDFQRCITIINQMKNNDLMTCLSRISGKFTM